MLGAGVDLQFLDHGVAERALRKHALHSDFEGTARVLGLHFLEGRFIHAARIAGVAVVGLLAGFFGRELDFVGVDHDDVVARIDVRREFGLVLAAQTAWLKANSEKIDAEIDVQLCNVYLSKVLGTMKY